MFEEFILAFEEAYRQGLPGKEGQFRMRPYLGISRDLDVPVRILPRVSAVMALFLPIEDRPHLLLIERPKYEGVHSGQLAFPGGRKEKEDASILHTALRETQEEIGLHAGAIEVIGQITDVYVLASNYNVSPFVGWVRERPEYVPDPREVEMLLEIPVETFLDENLIREKEMRSKIGISLTAPYYDIDGKILWGATAMMISEISELVRRTGLYS